jgi:hypothetical protein
MGHHPKARCSGCARRSTRSRSRSDGVDGSGSYLYGEGWNFGEVADDARFEQATQLNMAGTGIGTFNDRLRDAVRGGGPFDSGAAHREPGLRQRPGGYDPNDANRPPTRRRSVTRALLAADQVRTAWPATSQLHVREQQRRGW